MGGREREINAKSMKFTCKVEEKQVCKRRNVAHNINQSHAADVEFLYTFFFCLCWCQQGRERGKMFQPTDDNLSLPVSFSTSDYFNKSRDLWVMTIQSLVCAQFSQDLKGKRSRSWNSKWSSESWSWNFICLYGLVPPTLRRDIWQIINYQLLHASNPEK